MVTGYSLTAYGRMVEDKVRMTAYREAMRRHIHAGSVVVDIGSGPGITALLACQLGAARVYAIEPDGSVEIGPRLAAANGFADRVIFLRKISTEVELPERADVLLSDLRGQLPLLQHHIASIRDARMRLLRPGGAQLPQRDRLMVGLSYDPVSYDAVTRPWEANDFGLDLSAGRRYAINTPYGVNRLTVQSFGEPREWASIDYRTVEKENFAGRVTLALPENQTINGLELWFEAEICDGVSFSTGPDQPDQVYGRRWLALDRPVTGAAGDYLEVDLAMNLVNGDYLTRWAVAHHQQASGTPLLSTRQSSFESMLLSPSDFKGSNPAHVPLPGTKANLARFVMNHLDGVSSVTTVAAAAQDAFPSELRTSAQAMALVRGIARRYFG